jgi:vitamin B12 transporter
MTLPVSHHASRASLALAMLCPSALAFAQPIPAQTLAAVIVTANRAAQSGADVLSDFTTISSEQIARSGQQSLIELLQAQRGVEVARNGGPGTASSVFLRGADGKQTIVLIDGVRIGSSTLGSANWSALPLANIDHIEIVYGPLSTLYGADAIGGVLQIFTKRGEGAPSVTALLGGGSAATRSMQAGVSGSTEGAHSVSYALYAGHEHADGFSATTAGNFSYNPDNDGYDKDSASGQLTFALAKGHELGVLYLHSDLRAQYDNGASAYDVRSSQSQENAAVFMNNQILPAWRSHLQLTHALDVSNTDSSAAASGKSRIETEQSEASWQNDVLIGADTLQLQLGWRKEKVLSSATAALNGERSTRSAAAAYLAKREAHLVSVSARTDDSSQYGATTTGAFGYGYRFTPALRTSASVGTSFRAPTFNELYYPGYGVADNKPEHGRNAETGLYYDDGQSQLSAVAYRNELTDLLVTAKVCPSEPTKHLFGCAYNVNRATLTGVSLAARRQFGPFGARATLDLQDPRDASTDKQLTRRSRQHGSVALDYARGALTGGVELLASGRRFDDIGNVNSMGGYGLLNLYASWQFAPAWSLQARWDNAANKRYALARNYGTAGSTVFAALRYGAK